jgi:tRNA(fMet)-specific endonuclease VapC
MISYLIDTNHCSDLIQGVPHVVDAFEKRSNSIIGVSIITYAELSYMAEKSKRVESNRQIVAAFIQDVDLYLIDRMTVQIYSRLKADVFNYFAPKEKAKRRKVTINTLGFSDHDLWIAATALQHHLTLVSADNDFRRMQKVQNFLLESWR